MTTVVNIRSVKEWTPEHVYIGRQGVRWARRFLHASPFANPFRIGQDGSREEVLAKYDSWLNGLPELIERAKAELTSKILVCWCPPKACHGDILAALCDGGNLRSVLG